MALVRGVPSWGWNLYSLGPVRVSVIFEMFLYYGLGLETISTIRALSVCWVEPRNMG